MKRTIIAAGLMWAVMHSVALATGMLIPKDPGIPPLAIKYQRVDIQIKDGVATAKIEQVFKNNVDRDLEAVYVFPLPENAGIADFAMYIGGKRMSGELVEKGKARQIYEDIVRRMKDPGLLEHIGGNLFRVSVYPVPRNGEQKIELVYSQGLDYEAGLYKFVYPLRTGERASKTIEDFTVGVRLVSGLPIKNVYSPSHKVGINRKNDHEATIGFEEEQGSLDRDFVLYYGVSKKDFGLNLLTHAVKGQDGYFMMMISPNVAVSEDKVLKKDVVYVMDTSGSMQGEKIEQARKALEYCIGKLNKGDRFNIIRFSTDAEMFRDSLVEADGSNVKEALKFTGGLRAQGGTCINDALTAALGCRGDAKRPFMIVFLTDGKPTVGETDADSITANVKKCNKQNARIFVFGVGFEVNTHLLDRISGQNAGLSQYVRPEEDIEVKVSAFADKINQPVLTNLKVTIDKLKVQRQHPQPLPDLFCGDQLTVFGRYEGKGDFAIRLTGEVNGESREFVYEGTFPEANSDNDFIPRLWATRQVGYLLDQIRLHGEEKELKDEVIRLSKEYGIMTPYTSYLVVEDEKTQGRQGMARPEAGRNGFTVGFPVSKRASAPAERSSFRMAEKAFAGGGRVMGESVTTLPQAPAPAAADAAAPFSQVSGEHAVRVSQAIEEYKKRDVAADSSDNVRHIGGKTFVLTKGVWIDSEYKEQMKSTKVKFGSDDYFKLLAEKPELKKFFALGEKVIVCVDKDRAVVVE